MPAIGRNTGVRFLQSPTTGLGSIAPIRFLDLLTFNQVLFGGRYKSSGDRFGEFSTALAATSYVCCA
jgi:hypothetical protein